jgi:dolichyl-phosphate beta-glucosyltransferase
MSADQVSIILPAFNEGAAVTAALEQVLVYVDDRDIAAEIIVVDDGSRDDTLARAQAVATHDARVRVLSHRPNRGKGYSVREAVMIARMPSVVFLDVDMATPVAETDKALAALRAGADMVIGSRYLPGSRLKRSWLRRVLGGVFRVLASRMLRLQVSDVTCGFKGFTRETARELFSLQREDRWVFDAELIYLARKLGYRIVEAPVAWQSAGASRFRVIRDGIQSLRDLMRIRNNDRKGLYDV